MTFTNTTWKVVHESIMNSIVAHYFPFSSPEEADAYSRKINVNHMDSIQIVEM